MRRGLSWSSESNIFASEGMLNTYICVYFSAAFLALFATPVVILAARRIHAVDYPGIRSVHTKPIPRIGGVAIFVSTMAVVACLPLLTNAIGVKFRTMGLQLVVLLCAGTGIFAVGLIDDLRGLPARFKFVVETLGALALCLVGARIRQIGITDQWVLPLGWLAYPITVLWIVGITNAVNMSDGLDGLAAGVSAVTCGVIAIFGIHTGIYATGDVQINSIVMAVFALALLGSLSGFLFFNFNPAKVFMGDSGSLFIGFMIAAVSVICVSKTTALVALALPALALGIPIFDTLFAMLRRWLERRSLFAADRGHFHHRLLDMGLTQRSAVFVVYAATCVAAGAGLFMMLQKGIIPLLLLVVVLMMLVVLFHVVGAVKLRETWARLQDKYSRAHHNRQQTRAFEDLQLRFRATRDREEWWAAVCEAADTMEFAWLSLRTTYNDGRTDTHIWRAPQTKVGSSRIVRLTAPLPADKGGVRREFEMAIWANGSLEGAARRASLFGRLLDDQAVRLSAPLRSH